MNYEELSTSENLIMLLLRIDILYRILEKAKIGLVEPNGLLRSIYEMLSTAYE